MQIGGTKETDEPIAQVLALHQNENRNDQHDHRGFERPNDRLDNRLGDGERRRLWCRELDDDRLLLRTDEGSGGMGSPRFWRDGLNREAAAGRAPLITRVNDATRVIARTWIRSTLFWMAST